MVGVPGKYKGCETCRRRRVKCTNERPYCQKCVSSGRQCEGYERQRVFITGTLETKGRVASHPKKTVQPRQKEASSESEDRDIEVSPTLPLTSAWENHVSLSSSSFDCPVLVTALQMSLSEIGLESTGAQGSALAGLSLRLPPYAPSLARLDSGQSAYEAEARCFVCFASVDGNSFMGSESYCAFFFENLSAPTSAGPSWRPESEQTSAVQRYGPKHFNSFPDHYFFVRIYRPMALGAALLGRRETFLSSSDWIMLPWEHHPKSLLDQLFDLVLFLPQLLAHTDQLLPIQPTLARRAEALSLLQNCLALERQFQAWLEQSIGSANYRSMPYWTGDVTSPGTALPFSSSYTFRDGVTGLMFVYYWMSQILFQQCVVGLNRAIFQPVIDAYPDMWPNIPSNLQIDETRYQHSRDFAAEVCRGLDYVLDNTAQPDLLLAPMTVALEYYRELNAVSQDGLLEIMWLEAFKDRLVMRGQQIASALQGQRWVELSSI